MSEEVWKKIVKNNLGKYIEDFLLDTKKAGDSLVLDIQKELDRLNLLATRETTKLYDKILSSLITIDNTSVPISNVQNLSLVSDLMRGLEEIQYKYRNVYGNILRAVRLDVLDLAVEREKKIEKLVEKEEGVKEDRVTSTNESFDFMEAAVQNTLYKVNVTLEKWKSFAYSTFYNGLIKGVPISLFRSFFFNEDGSLKVGSSLNEEVSTTTIAAVGEQRTAWLRKKAEEQGYKYCWNSNPMDQITKPECIAATMAGVIPEEEMAAVYGFPPRYICRCEVVYTRPEWIRINREVNQTIERRRKILIQELLEAPRQKGKWRVGDQWYFAQDVERLKGAKMYADIVKKLETAQSGSVPEFYPPGFGPDSILPPVLPTSRSFYIQKSVSLSSFEPTVSSTSTSISLDSAEVWARKNIAKEVSFNGFTLEQANEYNKMFAQILKDYPEAIGQLDFFGTKTAFLERMKLIGLDNIEKQMSGSVGFFTRTSSWDVTSMIKVEEKYGWKNIIVLDDQYTLAKFISDEKHFIQSNFYKSWTPEKLLYHEFSHYLEKQISLSSSGMWMDDVFDITKLSEFPEYLRNKWSKNFQLITNYASDKSLAFIEGKVGRYAAKDFMGKGYNEFFAEAFSLYKTGSKDPFIIKFGKAVDEMVSSIREMKAISSAKGMMQTAIRLTPTNNYVREGGKWFLMGTEVTGELELKRLAAMRIPPAWKEVIVSIDSTSKIQAIGKDIAGRWQYRYSQEHIGQAAKAKFDRVKLFSKDMPLIQKEIQKGIAQKDPRAYLLDLENKTAIRVGSEKDFKAKVKAYGLTTLQNEHIVIKGNNISLNFTAKEGISASYKLEDNTLAKWLKERKTMTQKGEQLFPDVSAGKLNSYLKELAGGKDYSIKDFRTYHGTRIAYEELQKYSNQILTVKEKKAIIKEVSRIVSEFLSNTPVMAKNSYIDPMVWEIIGGL